MSHIATDRLPKNEIYSSEDFMLRFSVHAKTSPDTVAIWTTDEQLSYQVLHQQMLKWKVILSQYVGKRAVVSLERTPRLVAVLLALQSLRVTYIPVDPKTPKKRLLSIIQDSQAETLLHDDSLRDHDFPCVVFNIAEVDERHTHLSKNTDIPAVSDALAYIIYTSGSTGVPKGVAITYRALNHFLHAMSGVFLQEPHAVLLAVTTVAFDIAQLELWLPLWQGVTLFLANQTEHRDPLLLSAILDKYPITLLQSTPSFWSMLCAAGFRGKAGLVALSGGEPLSENLSHHLLDGVRELWNMYGPTEATVWCAMKRIQKNQPITIGRPIDNMSFFILNDSRELLPQNEKGELYIAGVGLSEGYINRDDLNRERFISWKGRRLYRVGDIAFQTSSGEFVISGRTDHQIKLRGYRIELEEIESCLKQYSSVMNACVVVFQEQLVAYLSVDSPVYQEASMVCYLEQHLPHYMIPHQFIYLNTLPLSLSGKVDRHALPKPQSLSSEQDCFYTPLESILCNIWSDAFQCEVKIEDNFFALGGHSLIAARIAVEVGRRLGRIIPLDILYRAPTIREFARAVEYAALIKNIIDIPEQPLGVWFSLTDYQSIFWLSQRFEHGLKVFNVVARRRVKGHLSEDILNKALAFVFQKHRVLSYEISRFYPAQRFVLRAPIRWEARILATDSFETLLFQSYQYFFYRHQFSLNTPLVVARLFFLPNKETELQVCLSHLIGDERSLEIFFEDLWGAYHSYLERNQPPVEKKLVSFDAYVLKNKKEKVFRAQEKSMFWKRYLQDTGYFPMPKEHILRKIDGDVYDYITYKNVPSLLLEAVRNFCAAHQLTVSEVLTAALGLALQRCVPKILLHDVLINLINSSRYHQYEDQSMGCFLDMAVIKLRWSSSSTLRDLALSAQRSWMETLEYQTTSSLAKYAAIGQFEKSMGKTKHMLIRGLLSCYEKFIPEHLKTPELFQSSSKIAVQSRKKHFFLSINVLNSFITSTKNSDHIEEVIIPETPFPVMPLASVLDIWFYSERGATDPKMLIAANLKTNFREKLASALIGVLEESCMKSM